MSTFERILPVILRHEGGYVNDPADPGGETKYGISKRSFPREDIKNLTKERAMALYRNHFWVPSKADEVPEAVRPIHFDTAVNCGVVTAIRMLQRAAGIADDGIFGPLTYQKAQGVTVPHYVAQRLAYYERIIARNPRLAKYRRGWTKRTNSFLP